MKSFKQYIFEDIELVTGHPRTTKSDMRNAQMDFKDYAEYMKPLGKIHKDYSLHREGRNLFITHDHSGKVVGHIDTEPHGSADVKKSIQIAQLNIDKNHTQKKIGHSLAVAAYKQLWRTGHTIHSDTIQSLGGASVWKHLINDPETREHVHAVHQPYGRRKTELGLARKLHTGDIWTSGSGEARRAGSRKGIRMHKHNTPEAEKAYPTRLVLKAKKKK